MKTLLYDFKDLMKFSTSIFQEYKFSLSDAKLISQCLLNANLKNQDGHGISRIPMYTKRIRHQLINPHASITVKPVTPVVLKCDGDFGMGFCVATKAMNEAIAIAKIYGISMVGVHNSNHFGSSFNYVQQALDENLMAIVFTNSSPALPPHGASIQWLGANPIAAGAPGKPIPFLMDMSCTIIARGKLRLASQRGEMIPEGVGLDSQGKPTRDGMEAFHGVTLPFGGVKGSAISLWMDIFAGLYTGAAFGGQVSSLYNDFTSKQNVGHLFIVMKPDLFISQVEFEDRMRELVERMKALPKAHGVDEILMVGEPELKAQEYRFKHGIPIQEDVVKALEEEARLCGVHPLHNI